MHHQPEAPTRMRLHLIHSPKEIQRLSPVKEKADLVRNGSLHVSSLSSQTGGAHRHFLKLFPPPPSRSNRLINVMNRK